MGAKQGTTDEVMAFIEVMVEYVECKKPNVSGTQIPLVSGRAREFRIRDRRLGIRLLQVLLRAAPEANLWDTADGAAALATRKNWREYRAAIERVGLGKSRGPLLLSIAVMAKENRVDVVALLLLGVRPTAENHARRGS